MFKSRSTRMRRVKGMLLAAAASCMAAAAHAALPPQVYQKARAEAPYHVQVAIEKMTPAEHTPGNCGITGKIVRIFRDTENKLKVGDPIGFAVSCLRTGDRPPIGGTLYTNVDALQGAKFIEAYLVGQGGGFSVVLSQTRIIAEPSDKPQLPVE